MKKCKNAARSISANTIRNLYADAAGHCQNPSCLSSILVRAVNNVRVNTGEMAHIIAASGKGPRGDDAVEPEALAREENLILLCLICHKLVDSQETAYPVDLLRQWKSMHEGRISSALDIRIFEERAEARAALVPYLESNRATFDTFGPYSDYAADPFSDAVEIWRTRVREAIIPNNRLALKIMDVNSHLLRPSERVILEQYRIHVEEFERKHLFGVNLSAVPEFPAGVNFIYCEVDS